MNIEPRIESVELSDGLHIVNVCQHSLHFLTRHGDVVEVPPSGIVIGADVVDETIADIWCSLYPTYDDGTLVQLVRPSFTANPTTLLMLQRMRTQIKTYHTHVTLIVGSIIAAQAYPGLVVSPVMTRDTTRAEKKIARSDRFTSYALYRAERPELPL